MVKRLISVLSIQRERMRVNKNTYTPKYIEVIIVVISFQNKITINKVSSLG